MMFAERWLSRATPASSATDATPHEKVSKAPDLEVATALLPGCNPKPPEAPGSGNAVSGSKGTATRIPAEISHFSDQVAGVAEVADSPARQPQHDDQPTSGHTFIHQSKVVAPLAIRHAFADLLDQFENGSALAEHDGGLSRSDAERQAFVETASLLRDLDPEVIEQAETWLDSRCPSEWVLGVLWLQRMPAPIAFPERRWLQFQADAVAFAGSWGKQAIDAGWAAVELFGLSARAPWYNWRGFGVIPVLNGRAITAIDTEMMTIISGSGASQRYRRRTAWYDTVPAWALGR